MVDLADRLREAAMKGMVASLWAQEKPDKIAVYDPSGATHTFAKINSYANKLVRLLRSRGVAAGDSVALLCSNRGEFVQVRAACSRGGYRLTPVNWHLNTDEAEYIINDCDAKALIAETRYPSSTEAKCPNVTVKLSIGGSAAGFEDYEAALAGQDGSDIERAPTARRLDRSNRGSPCKSAPARRNALLPGSRVPARPRVQAQLHRHRDRRSVLDQRAAPRRSRPTLMRTTRDHDRRRRPRRVLNHDPPHYPRLIDAAPDRSARRTYNYWHARSMIFLWPRLSRPAARGRQRRFTQRRWLTSSRRSRREPARTTPGRSSPTTPATTNHPDRSYQVVDPGPGAG